MKKIAIMVLLVATSVLLVATSAFAGGVSFGHNNGHFRTRVRINGSDIYYRNARGNNNYFSYNWREPRPRRQYYSRQPVSRASYRPKNCMVVREVYHGKKTDFVFRSGYLLVKLNQTEWQTDRPYVGQRWVGVTGPGKGAVYRVIGGQDLVIILKKEDGYQKIADSQVSEVMLLSRQHQPPRP